MESPETIRTSLQIGERVTSIDFKDAYFHIPIHSQSRKYMRFYIQGQSYQFKVLPFGLSTVVAKDGQTDGLTEGYKNPPVPRRLVGESHVPPNLSPAYTDLGSSLSRTRVAGERGEVRTGPKMGLQLRKLPVRPQGEQGQTHTRTLADLNRQDIVNPVWSGVSGPTVYVPYRTSDSHRKTSPPRSTSHETHTVALEKQLEGTRIARKGDTRSHVTPPSLKVVAGGKLFFQVIHYTHLYMLCRYLQKGWGAHLNEHTARGTWSVPESKLHINHLGLKAVFLALKEFQDLCSEVFKAICSWWHQPQVDLFATRFNNKLPQFVSPVPNPQAWAVDTLSLSWKNLDPYAFPPAAILDKVVEKLQDYPCNRIILIAPGWPNMLWFWDLVAMSSQIPLCLLSLPNLVPQPFNQTLHRNLSNLNLHAWLLEPKQSRSRQWQQELRLLREDQPDQSMRQSGPFLQSGASLIRWTSRHHL